MFSTFYCTHSLGPIIHITGLRPVSVTGFEGLKVERGRRCGRKGAQFAIEMVTLENNGIIKSIHGDLYRNSIWYSLYGSLGRLESAREDAEQGDISRIYVNLDDYDGQYKPQEIQNYQPKRELDEQCQVFGHGGSDFYTMWNFVEKIRGNEKADTIDVYEAMDMCLPGIFAYRSIMAGGIPMEIPNFRNKEEREKYRNDVICTDPKVAGDQVLPTTSTGTPEIPDEVYENMYRKWREEMEKKEGYTKAAFTQGSKKDKIELNEKELQYRIEKNYQRLCEPYYQIQEVFSDPSYDWPGDKEGRALLAFVCQAKMTGKKIPCMEEMLAQWEEKTNQYHFFGKEAGDVIDEQQLSSHNWYLRGVLGYYKLYKDEKVLGYAKSTFEHLYMNTKGRYASYPVERTTALGEGGVSGCLGGTQDGWILSTDVGCAFMSIDGLSEFYEVTGDERALELLKEMREVFMGIDKEAIKAQTHCTLTAARGFLRVYKINGDETFLQSAIEILDLYVKSGMTYTFQNFNWWNKGDTWTEPCAIVDSMMVALQLYEITGKEEYRVLAARVWHNGFASAQNPEGGAGPDSTISDTESDLYVKMYEAPFCCTMRFPEGLLTAMEKKDLLYATDGELKKDEHGRYMAGDIVYAEPENFEKYEKYMEKVVEIDGHRLTPLLKTVYMTVEESKELKQKVLFK